MVVLIFMPMLGFLNKLVIFSNFWAMVSECGPYLSVLFGFFVTGFVLYLSVKFLKQLLWKIIVFSHCFYCFPFFVFCLGPVVQNAFKLCDIYMLPFSVLWDGWKRN